MKRLVKYKKFLEQKNEYVFNDPDNESNWSIEEYDLRELFFQFSDEDYSVYINNVYFKIISESDYDYDEDEKLKDISDVTMDTDYKPGYIIVLYNPERTDKKFLKRELKVAIERLKHLNNYIEVYNNKNGEVLDIDDLDELFLRIHITGISIRFTENKIFNFSVRDIFTYNDINVTYDENDLPYLDVNWEFLLDMIPFKTKIGRYDVTDDIMNGTDEKFFDIFCINSSSYYDPEIILKYYLSDENKKLLIDALIKEIPDILKDELYESDIDVIKKELNNDSTLEDFREHSEIFTEICRIYDDSSNDALSSVVYNNALKDLEEQFIEHLPIRIIKDNNDENSDYINYDKKEYRFGYNNGIEEYIKDNGVYDYRTLIKNYLEENIDIESNPHIPDYESPDEEYFNEKVKDVLDNFLKINI